MFIIRELDTEQITNAIHSTLPIEINNFVGCFARDNIPWPLILQKSFASVIVNTDTINGPGKHFMCIIRTPLYIIIWDSLANKAHYDLFFTQVTEICLNNQLTLLLNSKMYQNPISKGCGYYCIWYILTLHLEYPHISLSNVCERLNNRETYCDDSLVIHDIRLLKERFYVKKCIFNFINTVNT